MFQFSGFASYTYEFSARYSAYAEVGFPIRKSSDQRVFATSPKLIAGSYVLHRLQLPRHPPYALTRLTIQYKLARFFATYYFHSSLVTNFAGQMCKKYTLALKKFSVFNNYLVKEHLA